MSSTAEKLSYLEETMAQLAYSQLKTEMSLQTLSREMREFKDWSKKQLITMNRQWGDLANKMGTLVEDVVAPNIPRIAQNYFGCEDLDYFAVRVRKKV